MITNDVRAYKMLPHLRHVYDKLWVAQSQGLPSGALEDVKGIMSSIKYPIFIKPRYGHLTACSRNCHKISNSRELKPYLAYQDMMWSSYIEGGEGMTDYIMLNGTIVNQLTYTYSPETRGNVEVWKLISSTTPDNPEVTTWVRNHIRSHTGFVNVQYRDGNIIEVGLRPARAGAYHILADNPSISKNIYNLFHNGRWEEELDMGFQPYYSFKCLCRTPILTLLPIDLVKAICSKYKGIMVYEYYFEPVHGQGTVFIHIAHKEKEVGDAARKTIENWFEATQVIVMVLLVSIVVAIVARCAGITAALVGILLVMLLGRFINPLVVQIQLWKAQKESWMGEKSLFSQEQFSNKHGL
tara:strand:+ start:453 stop:1514 length:1062 start_codon:yes stop_codon:yes gene_type:complete